MVAGSAHVTPITDSAADIRYTAGFYRAMAPAHLAFAATVQGRAPGPALRPRRMLELGFGQGFGLTLLAAANPDVAFEGCDLDPANAEQARRFAADAQLDNVALAQRAFEHAVQDGEPGDCDVVAAHGVLSWVSRAGEDAIVAIVRRRLRADGLFHVSYNCLPGWAPVAPIRELALEVRRRSPGGGEQQLALALDLLTGLRQRGAVYFTANPAAARHLDGMLGMDRGYLFHEYLGEHWNPLSFATVAARLADAGLTYAASATLAENIDQCSVPREVLPLLPQVQDPVLREMLRDFAANKQFRRDVFARGNAALAENERLQALSAFGFALAVPRTRIMFRFAGPLTELNGNPDFYGPIADRLAAGIARFDDLAALPAFAGRAAMLIECLVLLVHSGQVLPVPLPVDADAGPARRFNRMVVEQARAGRVFDSLASPVTRTGVPVTDFGLLALMALFDGHGDEPEAAARHGLSILTGLGRRPHREGRPIEDDAEAVAFLAGHLAPIVTDSIPLWRQLGML
jgi:predicted methyltransferase family protein/methyltransferase family protein